MISAPGPNDRLRIVVLGYIVRGPLGGLAWHHLQYLLGLLDLGHDAYFFEDSDDYPSCYDPTRYVTDVDPSYGLDFAARSFNRLGIGQRWTYHDAHSSRWHGPSASRALEICSRADLLINVSGVNPIRPWFEQIPVRALIDTDPVFTQVRNIKKSGAKGQTARHTAFFTFGENLVGPDDGFSWRPTRQPIVLSAWKVTPAPRHGKLTTVMQWDSYVPEAYEDKTYGMKSASFADFLDLPTRVSDEFELALGSPQAPRDLLAKKGWNLTDPQAVTLDPWTYQRYLSDSKAEFSVAKQGYVESRSGWFSERSAAYLASGRPVVVQQTGFSEWLEAGDGVIPFSTLDEAVVGIEDLNSRFDVHCRAAREVVEEYFSADKVLTDLLERSTSESVVAGGTAE